MKFKDCGIITNRDFFINPIAQSKYSDLISTETLIEGTITAIPNGPSGEYKI
jgi:hypothetical protein